MLEKWELKQRQSLPLNAKITFSKRRIKEFSDAFDGNIALSLSGKDSLVVYYLIKEMCLDIDSVYCNTGLEHPDILKFNKSLDIEIIRPKKSFIEVWNKYGVPFPSKKVSRMLWNLQNPTDKNKAVRNLNLTGYNRKGVYCSTHKIPEKWKKFIDCPYRFSGFCCHYLKEKPLNSWYKKENKYPIMGMLASESNAREKKYLEQGCNVYKGKVQSNPISIWSDNDVLQFLSENHYPYSKAYGDIINNNGRYSTTGESRTGCMACLFGIQFEKEPNRIQRLAKYKPAFYRFLINKFHYDKILQMAGIPYKEVD